jgi:glucose-6-phosphate 1-dehydrogenase
VKDAVLGQYTKDGDKPGYLDDETVEDKKSKTETFASTVLWIDNERWSGVPFIIKGGKGELPFTFLANIAALKRGVNQTVIQLKPSDNSLFGKHAPNELKFIMGSEKKITLGVQTKAPGLEGGQTSADLVLDYKTAFPEERVPNAYETVMQAVIKGDQSMCKWSLILVLALLMRYSRQGRRVDRFMGGLHTVSFVYLPS